MFRRLGSVTARNRSVSLVAAAMRHAGGGGRLRGLVLPSGGKGKSPFSSSSLASPNKKMSLEDKLDYAVAMLEKQSPKPSSRFRVTPLRAIAMALLGSSGCYLIGQFYVSKDAEENRANANPMNILKMQFHKLSREEEVIADVDFLAQRAADTILATINKRLNPVIPLQEKWVSWWAWWRGAKPKATVVPTESEWVTKAFLVAYLLQSLAKAGNKLQEDSVPYLVMGYLHYHDQDLVAELLATLLSIGFLKRCGDKTGHFYQIKKTYLTAALDTDKDFFSKLHEAKEKMGKKN